MTSFTRLLAWLVAAAAVLLLASCGGGGSPGDVHPGADPVPVPGEPNAFLLFPNPQVQPDGSLQTNTPAYAQAYYAAIDPNNTKDTFAKWKAANGFDTGTGTQVTAVFGDSRDLGFGRRMTARQNPDGTLAFFVENYLVKTGAAYGFSPINLEAAIVRDPKSLVYLAGIEFSPGPAGGSSFAKFFTFDVVTGQRETMVDIDGRGDKAMPGPCITCHGGRADALTPPDASGKPHFNLLQNAVSRTRGDTQGQLPPFEVDGFQFSTTPGYTRAEQEGFLKTMNRMVLCSYPLPAPSAFPEDACRRPASSGEWQGTVAALVKASYGGDGLPNPTYADVNVPASWTAAGQTAALHDGDCARVPHMSHHARNGDAVGHRFHDVREIPAVCGSNFCDRRQSRQHAAGEARVRHVPRFLGRSRRWRISSAAKVLRRATRAEYRCGPAVRSLIPGRIACSGRAPPACPAPAACTRTPTPGRSCRSRTGRSPPR